MADPWFRFYVETLHDPKVLRLSDSMFRAWVNLLAVAKIGDGIIKREDIPLHLRVSEKGAAGIVDYLLERKFLEDRGDFLTPHNWDSRQYKSDVTDPTAAKRQKTYRDRNKDRNADRNATVTVTATRAETDTDTEQIYDDDDAGEPPLISAEANRIADSVAVLCGHDLKFVPPAWCGAACRVQTWLNNGWPEEIILSSCREQMAKKRDGPPDRINYFEKGIAAAIARQNAPLPEVKTIEAQKVEVRRGSENIVDVARRLSGSGVSLGPRPSLMGGGEDGNLVRLLPPGRSERP